MGIDLLNAEAQKVFSSNSSNNNDLTLNVAALNISNSTVLNNNNLNIITTSLSIGKSIYPFEISPIIPIQPNEQSSLLNQQQTNYNNLTSEMLKEMLEYMQQDVCFLHHQIISIIL